MDREQPQQHTTTINAAKDEQLATFAQQRFYASALCSEARTLLQALVDNPDYNTDPSPNASDPIPFVERHLNHLRMYPKTNLAGYISNLKIMTNTKRAK